MQKVYALIDSLQSLSYMPIDLVVNKAVKGIDNFFHPLAIMAQVTLPDNSSLRSSAGDPALQEILARFEKNFAGLDVGSAQFVLEGVDQQIVTCVGLHGGEGISGTISVLNSGMDPLKHIIRQVVELFAGTIVLALTMRPIVRLLDLDKLLTEILPKIKHFGVEGVLAFFRNDPSAATWIEPAFKKKLAMTSELIEITARKYEEVPLDQRKGIVTFLPTGRVFENIAWCQFPSAGKAITALFGGKFKEPELVFSKFRSLLADIDQPVSYAEIVQMLKHLKQDHERIVKGERIAAILETAVAINHEINNPLTAILGNAQILLMKKEQLPEDVAAKLDTIEKSALRIRRVTEKLMSVVAPITTKYTDTLEMLDIERSSEPEKE